MIRAALAEPFTGPLPGADRPDRPSEAEPLAGEGPGAASPTRPFSFGKLAVALGISALFIVASLRHQPLAEIGRAFRAGDYAMLVPYAALLLTIHLLRVWRWGLLLRPLARVPFRRLNAVSAVGFMALLILPLRLGELARPYLLRRSGQLSFSAALASLAVERVIDGLWVTSGLCLLLRAVPGRSPTLDWLRGGAAALCLLFAGLLALAWLSNLAERRGLRGLHQVSVRLGGWLPSGIRHRLSAFARGLHALPRGGTLAGVLALTSLYWLATGLALWVVAQGFGFHLSFNQIGVCLGIRSLGTMLPAGPGMLGTFQGFTELGLSLFVPAGSAAQTVALANVLWAGLFVQQVGLGLLFLGSSELSGNHRPVTLRELLKVPSALLGRVRP